MGTLLVFLAWIGIGAAVERALKQKKAREKERAAERRHRGTIRSYGRARSGFAGLKRASRESHVTPGCVRAAK